MFWPPAEGALLACFMTILMNLLFLATGLIAEVLPQLAMHVQQPVLRQFNIFSLAMIALWSSVFILILLIRRNNPQSHIPGLIVTYLFGHPMVVMAYFNGVHSMVTGLLLAVTPAFGFVMFRNRHVMNALLLIWLEVILLGLAVSLGWLTDAPLYGDQPPNRFLVPIWFFIQVLIGFPVALALLMITRYIVSTLRTREAQVRELSRRDALTGVWNRGYLNELIAREVALSERSGQPLAMVVVDLDLFKRINDEYGHAAGDQALIHAARSLGASIREVDHLGRYGGEEFVLLLPNCDEENARITAERCRTALSAEPVKTNQTELTLNGSFGVAAVRGDKINSDELFRRADQALYQAKEAGRNRVVVAN
ncbi:GGDEF domain-containing protein [Alcanivorax sp. 1008]|uniref:GGDEF domain-containing protein n=1 Tax=Alcanivorax sp. 1008 TaxID=2816853 RepID=UPI001D3C963D|nr:diguanylate cyclase [Alcanivorax sp. 1008]MCC1497024.1 diguanylate cyclase [Alcanivorax sp. 1008]